MKFKKKRKNRLIWVHPINQNREEVGAFYTLFPKLRNDEEKIEIILESESRHSTNCTTCWKSNGKILD